MKCYRGYDMKCYRGYDIPYDGGIDIIEMFDWCTEKFGSNNFELLYRTLYFHREEDYSWFMLRWA